MSKSKRLMELMMAVNRMQKFTVRELAEQFQVSQRTILRDLQELGELGVPLYSEVGPHGGYRVLNQRVLPPIAFTEEEAVSIFFASHALRHYQFVPFEAESSSALHKFYHYMSGQVRERIDQMKNRVDFLTPMRRMKEPGLNALLLAAIEQRVLVIHYESRRGLSRRNIQPIGIYASNGLWYCPAYCFSRGEFRLFRCDRITVLEEAASAEAMDLRHVHLGNWMRFEREPRNQVRYLVELSRQGVQRCEGELWPAPRLDVREDGSGVLDQYMPVEETAYFARFFLGLGQDAQVLEPPELLEQMRELLRQLSAQYGAVDRQDE